MRLYKYYLVQPVEGDSWTYGIFSTYGKAHQFITNLILPDSPVLEIFGTDDAPDTYLTGETLFIYNSATGEIIPPDSINTPVYNLAKRVYKLIKAQDWTGEADGLTDIYHALTDPEKTLSIIEYLTAELESGDSYL